MDKDNLKNTTVLLQDNLDDDRNSIYFEWYSLSLSYLIFNICKTSFLNKGFVTVVGLFQKILLNTTAHM